MQTFFRLPWSSAPGCSNLPRKDGFMEPRRPASVQIPGVNLLKRKREGSPCNPPPKSTQFHKKLKLRLGDQSRAAIVGTRNEQAVLLESGTERIMSNNTTSYQNGRQDSKVLESEQDIARNSCAQAEPSASVEADPDLSNEYAAVGAKSLTPLQQSIEAEFSLEILLKHRELRLIEQELAKCQIALEQLRRCELIPYPGSDITSDEAQNVSSGIGPALEPQLGHTRPRYPAPWGVPDGPYTKHYARWLIPDTQFDSVPEATLRSVQRGPVPPATEGRTTRGSAVESGGVSKARSSRASIASQFQSVSNEYQSARGKQGQHVILRRHQDGQWVKLVCKYCASPKEDFSSAQGFLNHCRIQHKQSFQSHEAAAIACGQPVDEEEANAAANSQVHISGAQGITGRASNTGTASTSNTSLVHPLIRAAPALQSPLARRMSTSTVSVKTGSNGPSETAKVQQPIQIRALHSLLQTSPLVPSPEAPHLSALLRKRGLGGDLSNMINVAKTKCDLGAYDSGSDGEDDSICPSDEAKQAQATIAKPARRPLRGGGTSPLPDEPLISKKGFEGRCRKPPALLRSEMTPVSAHQRSVSGVSVVPESPELTPHTIDSNPGLVSDDEDDDVFEVHWEFEDDATPEKNEYTRVAVDDGYRRMSAHHGHTLEPDPEETSDPKTVGGGLSASSSKTG